MLFVYRGRASFYLRESTTREFPPFEIQEGHCGMNATRLTGTILLQREFYKYLGSFHRLGLDLHLPLKQVDPFLHAANTHPFFSGG